MSTVVKKEKNRYQKQFQDRLKVKCKQKSHKIKKIYLLFEMDDLNS